MVKNPPHIRLELEQDKFRVIFWKQPLETNKTFSERELMSTALSPSLFIPSDVCALSKWEVRESVNRLWLVETMAASRHYVLVLKRGY